MKKILAVVLTVIMLLSVSLMGISASYEITKSTEYPVIVVPGFMASELYKIDDETGEKVTVWSWDAAADLVGGASSGNLGGIISDFATYLLAGNVEPIAKRLGEGFNRIFADIKSNPDGTPYNKDVYLAVSSPEQTNFKYLQENYPDGRYQHEKEIMEHVCAQVGAENTFAFNYDFRLGAVDAAKCLNDYIDAVLEYTGSEKVNIFAVSHGGQVTGTYLTLYGEEAKVNNAVLTFPALGGAGIAYDAFNYNHEGFNFGDVGLLVFIQHAMMLEQDLQYIVEAGLLGFLDDLASALVPYCFETIGYWGSLWDFIPVEHYDSLKSELLDENESAELIAKSDFMHYEIMSADGEYNYYDGFRKAQQAGVNIYIMAGYDIQVVTGMSVTSDAIITTPSATGAYCAPLGERFADGYVQKVDTGFNQISPTMTVDASTGYLPEHTWYVQDYHHGMTYKDSYTRDLLYTLLLNDESYDVHSFERFPQFHATTNPAHAVHAQFDASEEGFASKADTKLVLTNICAESDVLISAINIRGVEGVDFGFTPVTLKPGESKSISFKGEFPEVSGKNFEITISYIIGNITPIGQRSFDFVLMNGEMIVYDEENPFVAESYDNGMEDVIGSDTVEILEKFGVSSLVSIVFEIVMKIYNLINGIVEFFTNK